MSKVELASDRIESITGFFKEGTVWKVNTYFSDTDVFFTPRTSITRYLRWLHGVLGVLLILMIQRIVGSGESILSYWPGFLSLAAFSLFVELGVGAVFMGQKKMIVSDVAIGEEGLWWKISRNAIRSYILASDGDYRFLYSEAGDKWLLFQNHDDFKKFRAILDRQGGSETDEQSLLWNTAVVLKEGILKIPE